MVGSRELQVPPLSLRNYFDHKAQMAVVLTPKDHSDEDYMNAAVDLLLAALKRNYGDEVTREQILDSVAYSDGPKWVSALLTMSGFSKSDPPIAAAAPAPASSR